MADAALVVVELWPHGGTLSLCRLACSPRQLDRIAGHLTLYAYAHPATAEGWLAWGLVCRWRSANNGNESAASSSPQSACACTLGWNPSVANRSGASGSIRSTTRHGSRPVNRSAAACSAADRQPRIVRSGHGSAGNETIGAMPAMTAAASPTRSRAAVTSATRSLANAEGER